MERFANATDTTRGSPRPALLPFGIEDWFCRTFPFTCPLTSDGKLLAEVISKLRQRAEVKTGWTPKSVVIAVPQFPGLREDLVVHAASRSGLRVLSTPHIGPVTQTSAAYAGSGRGLCRQYTDIDVCEDEMYAPPPQFVLSVHFDHTALRVVYSYMQHAVSYL